MSPLPAAPLPGAEPAAEDLQGRLDLLRAAFRKSAPLDHRARSEALGALESALLRNEAALVDALKQDFGARARQETQILEVFPTLDEIRHIRRHLKGWMRPRSVLANWQIWPSRARVVYQPLGVVGILGAWNYPILLTLSPLANALAAGNHAMVKPSELAPATAEVIGRMIAETFPPDYVTVVTGGAELGAAFSALAFDHIIFTGSARVGKLVMAAAAENLTPVTLELGGKSPTIIADDFDVDEAASRILYTKYVNAGQTCLAPDYLCIPEGKRDQFVAAAKKILPERYPDTNSSQYTSVIDEKSYRRLRATLEDAEKKGATVVPLVPGMTFNDELRKFPPHLVLDVTDDMLIMQEEIFGPLFPIKTYEDLQEVLDYVNDRDRPLGLYLFTNDRTVQDRVVYGTISGGVTINNCMMHIAQHDMPFGGVGASGIGHYHAKEGFLEFSKVRPVHTNPRWSMQHQTYPPYNKSHTRMFDFLMKWMR